MRTNPFLQMFVTFWIVAFHMYLLGSWAEASFSLNAWDEETRGLVTSFTAVFGVIICISVCGVHNYKQEQEKEAKRELRGYRD